MLGSLREFRSDPLRMFVSSGQEYGDVVRFRFGPVYYYYLRHPDHVQHVLQTNHRNFGKQTFGWLNMKPLLGEGLLTSDGDFWLRQRRIAQPAFHRERIAAFAEAMNRATIEMLARWEKIAARGGSLDVHAEMMRVTLRIVGLTLLSIDIDEKSDKVGAALTESIQQIMDRTTQPYCYLPLKIPTVQNRRFLKAIAALDEVVGEAIRRRREGKQEGEDLLSMLMAAKDEETGESMSDRQLRDEVMTILLAGHETTANALTWTFYLLSKHPYVDRLLSAELRDAYQGEAPALGDFRKLRYCRMVFQESLRLYPPAWMTARSVTEDDEIGGFRIRGGDGLFLCSYATHRHPAFWENPEGFDPERFDPAKQEAMPRFAYFPFGGGARQCIGNEFAMMEATLILATVGRNYRLSLLPEQIVEPEPLITLRPKHGMRMRVERRLFGKERQL